MKWIILLAIIALPLLVWTLAGFFSRTHKMSGQATVLSHRIAQRSELSKADAQYVGNWNYLVTFALSDGEEIELFTIQSDFQNLTDGSTGWLTWEGKRFLDFQTDR